MLAEDYRETGHSYSYTMRGVYFSLVVVNYKFSIQINKLQGDEIPLPFDNKDRLIHRSGTMRIWIIRLRA